MASRHMTDDEILAYLDQGASSLDRVFHTHLDQCEDCRARVEQYRSLYSSLEEDREFQLSPGFSGTVVARVAAENSLAAGRPWGSILLTAAGIAVGIGLAAYFIDFGPLLSRFAAIFQPSIDAGARIVGETETTVKGADSNSGVIILISALILVAIAGADHLLFRGRRAEHVCI